MTAPPRPAELRRPGTPSASLPPALLAHASTMRSLRCSARPCSWAAWITESIAAGSVTGP